MVEQEKRGINSRAKAGCACSMCGMGISIFGVFWYDLTIPFLFFLVFFSLFIGDGLILDRDSQRAI